MNDNDDYNSKRTIKYMKKNMLNRKKNSVYKFPLTGISIMSELVKKDIHLNISYPWPIHIMDAYKHFECGSCNCSRNLSKVDDCNLLPETEKSCKKIFSLPMYPTLTDEEQNTVIKELKKLI